MDLTIELAQTARVEIMRLHGRLTVGEEVKSLLARFEQANIHHCFVLNLAGLTYIDSSGIGALVRMLNRVRKDHGDIKLCEVPAFIRNVLRMTHLDRQFHLYDSEQAALQAFTAKSEGAPRAATEGPQVLCIHESVDMLAFLKTLLSSAGYKTMTTSSAADASVFLKTGQARLILLSSALSHIHGSSMVVRFNGIAPSVPVHMLTAEFAAQEPSLAGPALLEEIRALIS